MRCRRSTRRRSPTTRRRWTTHRAQYETGVGTEISVVEAENTLENAQAALTNLGVARAQYEHAIAMLIGQRSRRRFRSR